VLLAPLTTVQTLFIVLGQLIVAAAVVCSIVRLDLTSCT
jgi:hypothetical protein